MLRYIILLLLLLLFCIPGNLDFTLGLHNKSVLSDILFYTPFLIALIFGTIYGKREIWKASITGFFASIGSVFAWMWDFNHSIEGGWQGYGGWAGVFYTLFFQTSLTILSVYLGGWLKDRYRRYIV